MLERLELGFRALQPIAECRRETDRCNRVGNAHDLRFEISHATALRCNRRAGFARRVRLALDRLTLETRDHVRILQQCTQMLDQDAVDNFGANRHAGAYRRAAILARRAAVDLRIGLHDGAAAMSAAQQASEERGRETTAPGAAANAAFRTHALAHAAPGGVVDDAKLRSRMHDPL